MVKVIEPMVPVPAVTDTAPVPVSEHVAPAPGVTSAIRAPALLFGPKPIRTISGVFGIN